MQSTTYPHTHLGAPIRWPKGGGSRGRDGKAINIMTITAMRRQKGRNEKSGTLLQLNKHGSAIWCHAAPAV
jgi:hypothetical protein